MKRSYQHSLRTAWRGLPLPIAAIVASAVLLCLLTGCAGPKPQGRTFTIGVDQFMQHPLLDQVAKGLTDELAGVGISQQHGDKITLKNANGDASVAVQINKQFVDQRVDLLVALGTSAAQSACKLTRTIPIVFGAITDPVQAGIAQSIAKPGGNKTGTSDRWPFEQQVALIKQIVPGAKRVGIVLNPAESNTQASMSYVRPALKKEGLQAVEVPVANTSEVYGAANSLVGRCDVLLVPGDNTVIAAIDTLVKVARDNKLPLIGGTDDLVKKGSIATYASNYYQIGRTTGRIVAEILKDGKQPGSIPVAVAEQSALVVNAKAAAQQGVKIPASLLAKAKKV
jgi:putative ABC transport system substrate-binding protein